MVDGAFVTGQVRELGRYRPFPDFAQWLGDGFDLGLVDKYAAHLAGAKAKSTPTDLDRALAMATRYAAIDTGAIEGLYQVDRGFTRTVATQAAAWEWALDEKGELVRRSINDALAAYDLVLDAATGRLSISEAWIRELHKIICGSQSTYRAMTTVGFQDLPLSKGVYKQYPNNPTSYYTGIVHAYAPPQDTGPEMYRLVEQLRTEEFAKAHPVVQAAYAHFAYVCIHPFADGNGRVARALASVFLYRKPGIPLVVFADQRDLYIDTLEAADAGDHSLFVQFIADRVIDTIGLVRETLEAGRKGADDAAEKLRRRFSPNVSIEVIGPLAERLSKLVDRSLNEAWKKEKLPPHFTLQLTRTTPVLQMQTPPAGFTTVGMRPLLHAFGHSVFPVSLNAQQWYLLCFRQDYDAGPEFVVFGDDSNTLEVWHREIDPAETETLRIRLRAWAEREIARLVKQLADALPPSKRG